MRICTITCHDVYNYGASLQAFALQHYLQSLGHDVKIIDYKPDYQPRYGFSTKVSKESPLYSKYQKYPILKIIRGTKNYFEMLPTRGRIKAFEQFNNKFLSLTRRYNSFNELAECPPDADAYIVGSDQVWSTALPNGTDPSFYLCFGDKNTKRISYAASFAFPEILKGKELLVKSLLSQIDCISVREDSGLPLLKSLGYEGVHVLDPVFLLSAEKWIEALCLNIDPKQDYILVYDLKSNTQEMAVKAKELAHKEGLKIVAVNNKKRTKYADVNIRDASPSRFVELIANAKYVIADSFHATAFSIIFHKPMWIYYHKANVGRMESILIITGLLQRLNSKDDVCEPKWEYVERNLSPAIETSKSFLANNIKYK